MAKNIRSQYIKSLMDEKDKLNRTLEETTRESLKTIVDEAVNKNLRSMLTESDDDYKEEEVEEPTAEDLVDDTENDDAKEGSAKSDSTDSDDDLESDDTEDAEDEEEMWNSLEQYKDEDGEYDLTNMDVDGAIKVLRVMRPENGDGIRVVKMDNGDLRLTDDEHDTEYIIELGDECEGGSCENDGENEFEVEFDESVDECGDNNLVETDLGYTDNYQSKTAMTTPDNHEPADASSTYSMDGGVPTGTKKPWAGKSSGKTPYEEPVNEEYDVEVELDDEEPVEESTTVADKNAQAQGTTKTHGPNTSRRVARNGSVAGMKKKSTSMPRYSEDVVESTLRKADEILSENRQLRQIASQIRTKLNEACIINASLGRIIKLVTENTTTRDEKINIVKRFNNVKSITEGKELYATISNELKQTHAINNVNGVMSGQLTENRQGSGNNVVETKMYRSKDLEATIDMMNRLENI